MIKQFTCDQTNHSWTNRTPVTKPCIHNCSLVNNKNNKNNPGASLLWHFLGLLSDCETSLGLSMTDTSWGLIMIVKLPWASLWLWNLLRPHYTSLLGPLYECEISWVLLMIVTLPAASYWLRHFLGPLWLWHFREALNNNCGRKSELCFDDQCSKKEVIKFDDVWINWFGRIWGKPDTVDQNYFLWETHRYSWWS